MQTHSHTCKNAEKLLLILKFSPSHRTISSQPLSEKCVFAHCVMLSGCKMTRKIERKNHTNPRLFMSKRTLSFSICYTNYAGITFRHQQFPLLSNNLIQKLLMRFNSVSFSVENFVRCKQKKHIHKVELGKW